MDAGHAECREKIAIDVPGDETETLGEYAKEFGVYIAVSAEERAPEHPERLFNTAFVVDPCGLRGRSTDESGGVLAIRHTPQADQP